MTEAELAKMAEQGEYDAYTLNSGCYDYACPCHHKVPVLVAEIRRLRSLGLALLEEWRDARMNEDLSGAPEPEDYEDRKRGWTNGR